MRKPLLNLRVDADRKAAWQKAAGKSLSAFVADAADAAAGKDPRPSKRRGKDPTGKDPARTPAARRQRARAPQRQPRIGDCEHVVPDGAFCSRGCD